MAITQATCSSAAGSKHQPVACAVCVRMSGRKFRRKLVPTSDAAAPDGDGGEEPGSLAVPPSVLAARRPERGPAPRPAAKPLLSFGGDEDDSAAPARRGTAARGLEPDGRLRGVARAAALAVTEVRVGASTQVSGAGAAPAKPRRCTPAGRTRRLCFILRQVGCRACDSTVFAYSADG